MTFEGLQLAGSSGTGKSPKPVIIQRRQLTGDEPVRCGAWLGP
jgi:hypothetical protein